MSTKKGSKKETKRPADRIPPEPLRAPLQRAQRASNEQSTVCERFDGFINDFLRRSCAAKRFEERSGNCTPRCQRAEEPKIEPCLRLRWGDSPTDQLETEDTEILCITVCNPYTNVVLKNFTLHLVVVNADGTSVAPLPDGTPSVQIKPTFMICFDDIPPCDPQKPNQESCVSREVVFLSRGAKPGKYHVFVVYCFEACFTKFDLKPAAFELELHAS